MKSSRKSQVRAHISLSTFSLVVAGGLVIASVAALGATGDSNSQSIEFNRDIRPILSDKCFTCHGPDSTKRLSKLRFDTEDGAKQDLGNGRFAIVPGDSSKSTLIARVTSTNPGNRMPFGRDALNAKEIDLLKRWIDQGAKWEKFWSFIPPQRSPLPAV